MAGGKCVRGAEVIVFALRRSVRYISQVCHPERSIEDA